MVGNKDKTSAAVLGDTIHPTVNTLKRTVTFQVKSLLHVSTTPNAVPKLYIFSE